MECNIARDEKEIDIEKQKGKKQEVLKEIKKVTKGIVKFIEELED